jgi:anti-sigma factor RsiW
MDHLSDEILNEWLDEAVEPPARAAVEAHLAGCQDCAARLDTLRSLFVRLDTLPDLPLERDLSASVVMAIRGRASAAKREARAPWLAGLIFGGQAVAAVLLLAFAWPVASAFAAQLPLPLAAPSLSTIIGEFGGLFAALRTLISNPLTILGTVHYWLSAVLPAWFHPLEAGLVVAAAAGIWLVGNALVLSPPFLARLRRNS